MPDPTTDATSASPSAVETAAPYEEALNSAFEKLTSQVFIFLLAYMILLIGVSVFGAELTTELRLLLYVIPILGVAAYVLLERRNVVQGPKGVRVSSHVATDDTMIVGMRGQAGQSVPDNVDVTSGLATGRAKIAGIDTIADKDEQPASVHYLMAIFQRLDRSNQSDLIAHALHLERSQHSSDR